MHNITLHYITLHYTTLHYNTLHHITLHYVELHYITLHYIHTYIYIYAHLGLSESKKQYTGIPSSGHLMGKMMITQWEKSDKTRVVS